MILKVGEGGLLIPGELLAGADEVRLWSEGGLIVVQPITTAESGSPEPRLLPDPGPSERRSIFELLGSDPVDDGPTDASARHDLYLYGDPHRDGMA